MARGRPSPWAQPGNAGQFGSGGGGKAESKERIPDKGFASKSEAFAHANQMRAEGHTAKVMQSVMTNPRTGQRDVQYLVKTERGAKPEPEPELEPEAEAAEEQPIFKTKKEHAGTCSSAAPRPRN
jgi:hypothetical protein